MTRTYRTRATAMGSPYICESWRDHTPQARRQHIYGKVQALREEGHAQGMVRNRYGIVLLIGVFVLSVFACAAWGV